MLPPNNAANSGSRRLLWIKVDEFCRCGIETDKIRRLRKRGRVQLGIECRGQPCIGIIEGEGFQPAHGHG